MDQYSQSTSIHDGREKFSLKTRGGEGIGVDRFIRLGGYFTRPLRGFPARTENVLFQALNSDGIHFNKGYILWTLRQLCARLETLPKSYVLPIEFESSDLRNAGGGFADVWEGTYNGRGVAFKSIRWNTLPYRERLKRKVGCGPIPPTRHLGHTPSLF